MANAAQSTTAVAFPAWAWVTLFGVAGSAPGWAGDTVWSLWAAAIAIAAGVGLMMRRPAAWHGPAALAGAGRGAVFGLIAWLFTLLAWLAMEIALGGQVSAVSEAVIGAAAGAAFGTVVRWAARRRADPRRERLRRQLLGAAALATAAGIVAFTLCTGPADLTRYPPAAGSPYRLPWAAGVRRLCVQGNRAVVSHRGWDEFAYDFAMPVNSDVCAARGGMVIRVVVEHDGHGPHAPNNYITVDHGDGTLGWYLHLRKGGSYVTPGQRVRQGERIAASGNVGLSMLPHLHFDVTSTEDIILPVTFADVDTDSGIPRMFKRYTSGNVAPTGSEPRRVSAPHGALFWKEGP